MGLDRPRAAGEPRSRVHSSNGPPPRSPPRPPGLRRVTRRFLRAGRAAGDWRYRGYSVGGPLWWQPGRGLRRRWLVVAVLAAITRHRRCTWPREAQQKRPSDAVIRAERNGRVARAMFRDHEPVLDHGYPGACAPARSSVITRRTMITALRAAWPVCDQRISAIRGSVLA
jgi:hypothetical protein